KKFFLLFSFIPLILILYLSITYDDTSQVYLTLNKLLSGRLRISYSGFKEYGISLLGKRLPIIGYGGNVAEPISDYFYLDSLPVDILLRNGAIAFITYLLYNFLVLKSCLKNNDFEL